MRLPRSHSSLAMTRETNPSLRGVRRTTKQSPTGNQSVIARVLAPAAISAERTQSLRGHLCPRQSHAIEHSHCEGIYARGNPPRETNPSLRGHTVPAAISAERTQSLRGHSCPRQSQPRESNSCCTYSMNGIASLRSQ